MRLIRQKPVPVAESDVPDVAEDAESTPETVDVAEPATVAEVVKPVVGTPDVEQDEHDESASDENRRRSQLLTRLQKPRFCVSF